MRKLQNILKIICLIIILKQKLIWCRVYEECEGITEPDAVVASKRSCAKYIFCDGENSNEGECLAGNYFNEIAGTCDDPENVKCEIPDKDDVISIFAEDFKKPEIERQEDIDEIDNEPTPDPEDIEVTDDLTVDEDQKDNSLTEESYLITLPHTPKCPQLYGFENIKHIANPASCVAFYTCYNTIAIPMLCPKKLYFNDETGKCENQIPKNCKLKHSVILNCHKGVYDYMPHLQRCEYYHYCMNGFLLIMRCPYEHTWHYERRTCVHRSQSKCYFEESVIYRYPS